MSDPEKTWHQGGCHCGAVSFEVLTPQDVTVTECNCSVCHKTGYQHLFVTQDEFKLLTGSDDRTTYLFGTHTARHHFCRHCGVKSYYVPRSHPDGYSINFRCLAREDFANVKFEPFDGENWDESIDGLRGE